MYVELRNLCRNVKYFTYAEQMETLSPQMKYQGLNKKAKRQTKQYTYKSGARYDGSWLGGMRDGQGKMQWVDGAAYEGDWKDNRAQGKGRFTYPDGDVYEGNFYHDRSNGFGVYTHLNGAKYEGEWYNDV